MIYQDQLSCPDTFPWKFIHVFATEQALFRVMFANNKIETAANAITESAREQLLLYFQHQLTSFDLPVDQVASGFAQKVYSALREIAYGTTQSYQQIAVKAGSAKLSRATGRACGANQISIIVPCHRVISSQGKLTGYASGLETKRWLLNHESAYDKG